VRIRSWYGDQTKASYYVNKKPGFVHVTVDEETTGWDYSVLQTVAAKFFPAVLDDWPPLGTVYEVRADGTPLAAVIANYRVLSPEQVLARMADWAESSGSHATYVSLAFTCWKLGRQEQARIAIRKALELEPGLIDRTAYSYHEMAERLYGAGYFEEAIGAYRLSLERHPNNPHGQNRICKASIELERWEQADRACRAALDLDPRFEEARQNLRIVLAGLARK
jgi:tetratricopeptide (TPR) repeat protein